MTPFQIQTNKNLIFGSGERERLVSLMKEFPPGLLLSLPVNPLLLHPRGKAAGPVG
jgi:hypothetical protein